VGALLSSKQTLRVCGGGGGGGWGRCSHLSRLYVCVCVQHATGFSLQGSFRDVIRALTLVITALHPLCLVSSASLVSVRLSLSLALAVSLPAPIPLSLPSTPSPLSIHLSSYPLLAPAISLPHCILVNGQCANLSMGNLPVSLVSSVETRETRRLPSACVYICICVK
jgi:hypothetical protein